MNSFLFLDYSLNIAGFSGAESKKIKIKSKMAAVKMSANENTHSWKFKEKHSCMRPWTQRLLWNSKTIANGNNLFKWTYNYLYIKYLLKYIEIFKILSIYRNNVQSHVCECSNIYMFNKQEKIEYMDGIFLSFKFVFF